MIAGGGLEFKAVLGVEYGRRATKHDSTDATTRGAARSSVVAG
jgi:hypothetical protein